MTQDLEKTLWATADKLKESYDMMNSYIHNRRHQV